MHDFDVVPPLQHVGSAALRARYVQWFAGWKGSIGQEVRDLDISPHGWLITHEHISLPVDVGSGTAVADLVP